MAEDVDLTLLAKLVRENLTETKALRREVADVRTLALQTADFTRRMEQHLDARINGVDTRINGVDARVGSVDTRIASLRDDLELMVKSELMGRLAHFETRIEHMLDERLPIVEKTD